MIRPLPVFAICGWSGAGKTTLIEQLIPPLRKMGLKIAVVKHDVHGIHVDRPGKDSDRFFQAGADVHLQAPDEEFLRCHRTDNSTEGPPHMQSLVNTHDLVLVEGHKQTSLPKVWLLSDRETQVPDDVDQVVAVLSRDSDRVEPTLMILEDFLTKQWLETPVYGCVLIGGKSSRMRQPKHLLREDDSTWLERTVALVDDVCQTVVIAGSGEVPDSLGDRVQLPDIVDARGPLAGMLAAMRWAPFASWIVAACDLPSLSAEALRWLMSTRRPGVWATLPRLTGSVGLEPLLAYYDFRCRVLLEDLARNGNFKPIDILSNSSVTVLDVPSDLAEAWKNVNTPDELGRYTGTGRREDDST